MRWAHLTSVPESTLHLDASKGLLNFLFLAWLDQIAFHKQADQRKSLLN